MKNHILIIFLSLSLISCIGIPELKENPTKNLVQTNIPQSTKVIFQSDQWWLNSKDEGLNLLIKEILSKNSEIKVARLNIEKALYTLESTKSSNISPITLSGSFARNHMTNTRVNTHFDMTDDVKSNGTTYIGSLSVEAQYTLDLWDKFEALTKQAEYSKLANELQAKWTVLNISTLVSNLYGEYIFLSKEINIYEEKLKISKEIESLQKILHETGLSEKSSLLKAENNTQSTQQALSNLQNSRYALRNSFFSLIGNINSTTIEQTLNKINSTGSDFSYFLNTPEYIDSDMIVNRPDIQYFLTLINSQRENIISLKADFYPRFSISGKYEYQSIDILNIINGSSNLWGIGPSLYLPLFNRNILKQNYKIAGIDLNIFIENYNNNLIESYLKANNSLNSLKISERNNQLEKKNLLNSKEILNDNSTLYSIGSISKYNYLISKDQYLSDKLNFIKTNYTLYKNQIDMINALGGYYKEEVK
ncbi:TolC family protein [uncultured Cetobacterium sp.]|uniref:TolC family protein n=1 Tax=uncultured Cetobacterium sp. TaxID=527638 RepID=UPI0026197192|nr:TolC family protein [uncultured Cetobacterium sp.]